MQDEQKTQLEQALEQLVALVPNISTSDREAAEQIVSEFTVIQYLKGRGKRLDTAVKLLTFFRNRISERQEILES